MYDSNMTHGGQGKYLYEKKGLQLELFATPQGRIPTGHKQKSRTIAVNKKGSNRYPDEKRLEPAISICIGDKIIYIDQTWRETSRQSNNSESYLCKIFYWAKSS